MCIRDRINEVQKDFYANPSSVHSAGKKAKAIIEISRNRIASAINAKPEQIIFTSGGTESNNQVFWSMLNKSKSHVISNKIEHLQNHARSYASEEGFDRPKSGLKRSLGDLTWGFRSLFRHVFRAVFPLSPPGLSWH